MRQSLFFTAMLFIAGPTAWLLTNAPAQDDGLAAVSPAEYQQPVLNSGTADQAPAQAPIQDPAQSVFPNSNFPSAAPTPPSPPATVAPNAFDTRTQGPAPQNLPSTTYRDNSSQPFVANILNNDIRRYYFQSSSINPADAEAQTIALEYRKANTDEQRKTLRDKLATLTKQAFSERLAERRKELSEMQSQVDEMNKRLIEREKLESEIVERRVAQLLDEPDPLDWNTAMDHTQNMQYGFQPNYAVNSVPALSARSSAVNGVQSFSFPNPPSLPSGTTPPMPPQLFSGTQAFNTTQPAPSALRDELANRRDEVVSRLEAQNRALQKQLEQLRAEKTEVRN